MPPAQAVTRAGGASPSGGLNFELSTAVNAPNPQNIVNVVLFGLPPADGEASAVMPAFRHLLNDQQVADLLAYMRERFSEEPPWAGARRADGQNPFRDLQGGSPAL
ncbi:cytochrome c (plasmid) [Sinorhizobium meliloti]|nr:cytochrome c [Sinorhizobium meliloti]